MPTSPRFLRGTFLEDAPILPLSNVTGEGFDPFLEALWPWCGRSSRDGPTACFACRWSGHSPCPGYGTVVAGIPVAGLARTGDEVVLLPHNITGRIRRIEVYGQTSDTVMAGQCAAPQRRALGPPRDPPWRRADRARLFLAAGVVRLLAPAAARAKSCC